LKFGRHFRLSRAKLVCGRNENENEMITSLALPDDLLLEVKDYKGPVALLRGDCDDNAVELAASIVHRYSDAPRDQKCIVTVKNDGKIREISVSSFPDEELNSYRI
jgi:predicted ribosome quality control (RQC) complex YloA/Tae2 family protein